MGGNSAIGVAGNRGAVAEAAAKDSSLAARMSRSAVPGRDASRLRGSGVMRTAARDGVSGRSGASTIMSTSAIDRRACANTKGFTHPKRPVEGLYIELSAAYERVRAAEVGSELLAIRIQPVAKRPRGEGVCYLLCGRAVLHGSCVDVAS